MKKQLEDILSAATAEIAAAEDEAALKAAQVAYLGKKGALTAILRGMGSLTPEERPVIGAIANEVRNCIEQALEVRGAELKKLALAKSLAEEKLDVTYNAVSANAGHIHPHNRRYEAYDRNFYRYGLLGCRRSRGGNGYQ